MAKRKKQVYGVGDCFLITLADGSFCMGQIVAQEREALNSVVCAFFARRSDTPDIKLETPFTESELISVLFVTRDLLDSGDWRVFFNTKPFPTSAYLDMSSLQASGFVGVKVIGSGIVIKLMNAYYGLYPWNSFYEPDYLDRLLVSANKKPHQVVLK